MFFPTPYTYILGPAAPVAFEMTQNVLQQSHTSVDAEDMTADERQPLLRQVKSREDVYDEVDLPEDWGLAYKWGIVALLAFMAFTV